MVESTHGETAQDGSTEDQVQEGLHLVRRVSGHFGDYPGGSSLQVLELLDAVDATMSALHGSYSESHVGLDVSILYPDTTGLDRPTNPASFHIAHICRVIDDHHRVRCAPALHPAHRVEWRSDGLWISPSILCPDCGLHGYVSANRWEPVK